MSKKNRTRISDRPVKDRTAISYPEFRAYAGMFTRCYNENDDSYPRYGGRGIVVCDRWVERGFWAFIADMGERPSSKHQIERKDNDGPYSPENCVWATAKEQGNNRRSNKLITHSGVTLTMRQLAEKFGIGYATFRSRIRDGVPMEQAILRRPLKPFLTQEMVDSIRKESAAGASGTSLAKKYGVGKSTISVVLSRKRRFSKS